MDTMTFFRISKSRTSRKGVRTKYVSAPSADRAIALFSRTSYFSVVRKISDDTYQPIHPVTHEPIGKPIFVTPDPVGK